MNNMDIAAVLAKRRPQLALKRLMDVVISGCALLVLWPLLLLIALAISGLTNPLAAMVQRQLNNLRGCEAHFSVIISEEDRKLYKRLGINVSCEPKYEVKKLYHK